jgi:hypothetical protein
VGGGCCILTDSEGRCDGGGGGFAMMVDYVKAATQGRRTNKGSGLIEDGGWRKVEKATHFKMR